MTHVIPYNKGRAITDTKNDKPISGYFKRRNGQLWIVKDGWLIELVHTFPKQSRYKLSL